VAGEHAELDEIAVGELAPQRGERLLADRVAVVQLVDGAKQQDLAG
jgi:hypothetical protein